ncbi:hypothetical protein BC828DRAFT_390435 [Blastocladiella britannica]|nr:hypothetical protein BC828DRAFT_390435 [Blastocladiella britannica]
MLRPSRLQSVASLPLEQVVRAWEVPYFYDDEVDIWKYDTPEPLKTRLAMARLRPAPEALQLPILYLYMGELDQFMDVVCRLQSLLPTLTTATAPVYLWTRLGLDGRLTSRRHLSAIPLGDGNTAVVQLLITLPMYWAMVAASEGRVAVLDFLTSELAVEKRSLTAFLSLLGPTRFFVSSLIHLPTADRVAPTWQWLVDCGYEYPAEQVGPLAVLSTEACEYATMHLFFTQVDKPRLLAMPDLEERRAYMRGPVQRLCCWAAAGHYDLFPEFAQLGLFTPAIAMRFLMADLPSDKVLPVIVSACSFIDGGVDAVIEYGMMGSSTAHAHQVMLLGPMASAAHHRPRP